jgi:hypothetical protein
MCETELDEKSMVDHIMEHIYPTLIYVILLQVQCNECNRWIHALCEGLDTTQYAAIAAKTHPIWVNRSMYMYVYVYDIHLYIYDFYQS